MDSSKISPSSSHSLKRKEVISVNKSSKPSKRTKIYYQDNVCKFFLQGNCKYGESCIRSHKVLLNEKLINLFYPEYYNRHSNLLEGILFLNFSLKIL